MQAMSRPHDNGEVLQEYSDPRASLAVLANGIQTKIMCDTWMARAFFSQDRFSPLQREPRANRTAQRKSITGYTGQVQHMKCKM